MDIHCNKQGKVGLIKHSFIFVPYETAATEHTYFSGHVFHYVLGDHVSKLLKNVLQV
jgi:hypothetical protein